MLLLWSSVAFAIALTALAEEDEMVAEAVIFQNDVWMGKAGQKMGTIIFRQGFAADTVKVSGNLTALGGAGKRGFHIHGLGSLDGGCAKAKGHFNPEEKEHGAPSDSNRHVGDLGNIMSDAKGFANVEISDSIIQLHGPHSIIGRSVVVHAGEDDLGKGGQSDSKTTGHAGGRLGCGVVAIKSGINSASTAMLLPALILLPFLF